MNLKLSLLAICLLTLSTAFTIREESENAITYSFSSPVKDYTHKVELAIQGVALSQNVTFVSNFDFTAGYGTCFTESFSNVKITTVTEGSLWKTTLTNKNLTKGFNLSASCVLTNTNSSGAIVLPGVSVPLIYDVWVDNVKISILKPCEATKCADPGKGFAIAGYYAQWSVWGREYNPYHIPYNKLNQIFYAFIGFNSADGSIKTLDLSADGWGLTAIATALKQYPYLKAHLSFGGWTNNGNTTAPMFEALASSQSSMDKFASQSVALMRKIGFTGIDIDWEWWSDYSANVAPARKTLAFIKTLRKAIDIASTEDSKQYRLTMAINAGESNLKAMENPSNPNSVSNFWSQIGVLVDQLDIMSYDYHGGADKGSPAYFQAVYDFSNTGSHNVGQAEGWCIKSALSFLVKAGVPSKRLVVGIPLYARSMKVSGTSNGGLFETVSGPGFGDYEDGIFDYKCLMNPSGGPATGCGNKKTTTSIQSLTEHYNVQNNTQVFDTYGRGALQPWAFSPSTHTFATYDDQWSVSQKATVVRQGNFGGVMYWQIDGDMEGDKSLIAVASSVFAS